MVIDANKLTRSGQLAGWDTYSPTEKLALKVVWLAIQDYSKGEESEEYFKSVDFEYWCSCLQVAPSAIRERLGIMGDADPVRVMMNNRLNKLLEEL